MSIVIARERQCSLCGFGCVWVGAESCCTNQLCENSYEAKRVRKMTTLAQRAAAESSPIERVERIVVPR